MKKLYTTALIVLLTSCVSVKKFNEKLSTPVAAEKLKADVDYVVETNRSTTLSNNGATVNTVEHLLAAFVGCEVDNVLVKIDGPEIPILDGSSRPYVEAIEKVGRLKQNAIKTWYSIDHNIYFLDENKKVEMVAMPSTDYRINTLIDFRTSRKFTAGHGETGHGRQCTGSSADDVVVKVPCGTLIFDEDTDELLADLVEPGQRVMVAKGGDGGQGNLHFKTSTNRAPRKITPGIPGEARSLRLELKLLATIEKI